MGIVPNASERGAMHSGFSTPAAKRSVEALQEHLNERWPNIAPKQYPDDHLFVGIACTSTAEVIALAKWEALHQFPKLVEQRMFDELNVEVNGIRRMLVGAGLLTKKEAARCGVPTPDTADVRRTG